jgi:hypothetical protein
MVLSPTLHDRSRGCLCDLLSCCPVMANLASCFLQFRGQWLDVTRNVPQERANLTSDRNNSDGRLLAFGREAAVAGAQPGRCLPCEVTDYLWQFCQSFFMAFAHSCRMPGSPGSFDQGLARTCVARLVIPPRMRASPVDRSDGTSPRNAISCRGRSNRRTSQFRQPRSSHSPSRGHALPGTRPPLAPSSIAEQSRPAPRQGERSARRSNAPH